MSAIPNCNDGSERAPRLRFNLNISSIAKLPSHSTFPGGLSTEAQYRLLRTTGIESLDWGDPCLCKATGLRHTKGGRIDRPEEADAIISALKTEGHDCATFHVGTGFESDAEMDLLAEAILEAGTRYAYPTYIETHRATVTQDIWRTMQWVKRFPELRFNGDFSHWYTGSEFIYGDWERKLAFMQPVLERVRFIHGRIGNSGSIQIEVTDLAQPNVLHFMEIWTRTMAGFLRTAKPGDYLYFTPELLPADANYARTFRLPDGSQFEEGDRWQQALLYWEIARKCWLAASEQADFPL